MNAAHTPTLVTASELVRQAHGCMALPVAKLSRELKPIPWGQPDAELARGVVASIERAMPELRIPFVRGVDRKLRDHLRHLGIRPT